MSGINNNYIINKEENQPLINKRQEQELGFCCVSFWVLRLILLLAILGFAIAIIVSTSNYTKHW